MAAKLILDNYPRPVVGDLGSDAGKLQGSVQTWAQEVYQAMLNLNAQVVALQNAPKAAATPAVAATQSVTQVIASAGANGWSPQFALVPFAGNVLLQLTAWVGGTGSAPTSVPQYVGPAGFTTSPAGATNLLGPSGAAGAGFQFLFSAGVTAPPAAGVILFDNAAFGSIANVYVNDTDRNGTDLTATLAKVGVGSVLEVFQEGSSVAFATFVVTGATVHTGYLGLAVTPLSGAVLTDLQPVGFTFTGAAGNGNVVGPGGAVANNFPAFNGVTGLLLKDSGSSPSSFDAAGAAAAAQAAAIGLSLQKAANLSDLASAGTARGNLGLGTAAVANKVAAGSVGVLDATDSTTTNSRAPNGSAGGDLAGSTYPSPIVSTLSAVGSIVEKPIGYATGGNVQVRFDLGAYDAIGLTVNASFSPSGSAGLVKGAKQRLDLKNTTGGTLTLAWNAAWQLASGALPTSILAGASLRVFLACTGITEASILASYDFSPTAAITQLTADVTAGPGSGAQVATVVAIRGNAVAAGAPSRSQSLRWNGTAYAPVYSAYIYPEDFGATGAGASHDDSQAIMNAYAAVGPGQALYLGNTYGIGTAAALNFNSAKAIMSSGTAQLLPTTVSPATNGMLFTGYNLEGSLVLPNLFNFSGYGVQFNISLAYVQMGFINQCAIGIQINSTATFSALDNTIFCQSIYNSSIAAIQCLTASPGFLQGNRVDCNFINSCKRWVHFSASSGDLINENTFACDAVDMANIGGVTVIHNATGFGQNENSFIVRGFWGGLTGADAWVNGGASASNNLDKCTFDFASGNVNNGSPTTAQQYASFTNPEFNLGWGNTVRVVFGAKMPNNTGIACSATAGARAAFNAGNAIYFNRVLLTATVPGGGVAAGATFTVFAYHPFVQGNARLSAAPSTDSSAPMGFVIDQLSDNTGTNANEIKIVLRNITGATVGAGAVIPFMLLVGLP